MVELERAGALGAPARPHRSAHAARADEVIANPVRTDRMPRDLDTLSKDMRGVFCPLRFPPRPQAANDFW
jgi:hypothetical protein